jgi:alpha-1,6-mannosyltransferase
MTRMDVPSQAPGATRPRLADPRLVGGIGLAGSVLIAASSYWVAAIPAFFRKPGTPVISLLQISGPVPRLAYYVGLATLALAWLQLGRLTLGGAAGTGVREQRWIAFAWLTPIVFATPIGSRDLWAYAAQGQLVNHHLNPYVLGPAALPGAFATEVSSRWVDTPAPYGPLWLGIGHLVAATISSPWLTTMVLRLLAVAGIALAAWALPTLATRAGGRADLAIWTVVANPLFLVLGVGGGHNDLLMIGLMLAGLRVATGPGSAGRTLGLGTLLVTAAVAIKSPAVVALAFLVPLWLHHAPSARSRAGTRTTLIAVAAVVAGSVAEFAAITALSGLGWGWLGQINASAPIVNWMSIPTLLAICWNLALGITHGTTSVNATMRGFRLAGTVVTLLLLTVAWLVALRRNWWGLLAGSLFVVVVLGPTVQPWYFCWSLAVAAAIICKPNAVGVVAGGSIALVALIRPNGTGLQMLPPVIPIIVGAALLAWFFFRRPPRAKPREERAMDGQYETQ